MTCISYAQFVLNIFLKIMTKVAQNQLFNLLSVAYRGRSCFFVAVFSHIYPISNYFSSLAVLITFCKWLNTQNPEIEIRFHKKTRRFGLRLTTRILLVDLLVVWSDRILHYFTFCTTLEIQYTNSINLVRVTCSRKKRVLVVLLEFDSIYASIYQANNIVL